MKKKIALIVFAFLCVAVLFSGCNGVSLNNNVGEVKYKAYEDHAEVVALPNGSNDEDIVIADEYEGVPVTIIKDFAGCNLESAKVIHIGKNIAEIGDWAFSNNQKLTTYDVDDANENFCDVDGIVYSKDLTKLYYCPCVSNEKIVVADTVEEIGARAFYKNEVVKSVTLPNSLKTIREMAFFQCSSLENVVFPQGLESIGKDAFTKCTTFTEITIPSSVSTIGEYAFYNCTSTTKVTVENKQSDVKYGKQWYPTNNGITIDSLEIVWQD